MPAAWWLKKPIRFTAYAMLVACVVCVLQFVVTHDTHALVVPTQVYWLTFAMAIVSTVIPVRRRWWDRSGRWRRYFSATGF